MLKQIQSTGQKDTRSGFGDGIVEVARQNADVVALTADLAGSLKLNQFIKEFPERFFQCGIAEANMIGVAPVPTKFTEVPATVFCTLLLNWIGLLTVSPPAFNASKPPLANVNVPAPNAPLVGPTLAAGVPRKPELMVVAPV